MGRYFYTQKPQTYHNKCTKTLPKHKGLEIYAWVLMHSHMHMICRAGNGFHLSDILRDFKKFTSKQIVKQIINEPESRKEWLLPLLKHFCKHLARKQNYKVWQDGNHAEIIFSNKFFYEKLNYIHQNPVQDMVVNEPYEYLFSSARNYSGLSNVLDVILETQQQITYN